MSPISPRRSLQRPLCPGGIPGPAGAGAAASALPGDCQFRHAGGDPVRKSNGRVDGFVVELPVAGGHNAPPRGQVTLNSRGEPIYGLRDERTCSIADIGLPFCLAGGYASPEGLARAQGRAPAAFRWAPSSPSARNPASPRTPRETHALVATMPPASSPIRWPPPPAFPSKSSKCPAHSPTPPFICGSRLRPRLLRSALPTRRRHGRLPLPGRTPRRLRQEGRRHRRHGRPQVFCNGLFGTLGMGGFAADGSAEPAIMISGDDIHSSRSLPLDRRNLRPPSGRLYGQQDVLGYLLAPPAAACAATNVHALQVSA